MFRKGDRVIAKGKIRYNGIEIGPGQLGRVHDPAWCKRYLVVKWDNIKALYMVRDDDRQKALIGAVS